MAERPPIRLALDEALFRDLVAGKVVRLIGRRTGAPNDWPPGRPVNEPVELILSDIGWDRMQAAIDDAERERGRG